MTLAEFRGALEKDGVPFAAYREDLREQMHAVAPARARGQTTGSR